MLRFAPRPFWPVSNVNKLDMNLPKFGFACPFHLYFLLHRCLLFELGIDEWLVA